MSEDEKKIKARENAKKYYQKHREKILARQKEYVRKRYHTDEEFRKRTLENHKRYENNNLERVKKIKKDAQKKYYQQHIDYYRNYSKQWSKEKHNSLKKEIEGLNNKINSIFSNFEQFINSYKNDKLDDFFIVLRLSELVEFHNDLKEVIKSEY